MTQERQIGILESLLFVAGDEGLSIKQLIEIMGITYIEILNLLETLKERYEKEEGRGLTLLELAGTFQLATKKQHAEFFKKLVSSPHKSSLTQASLETLAIIAYKQPITRVEVDEIRGVQSDGAIRTLVTKGLITDNGRTEKIGRAKLYATTNEFLDAFGMNSLDDLPKLPNKVDEANEDEMDLFFHTFQQRDEQESE